MEIKGGGEVIYWKQNDAVKTIRVNHENIPPE